ncbi:Flavin-containing monooxygenase (plasmid) [Cupriavidus sp. U2]|uniref:flavin-containing monooxygenase n=1 Tax=Cupriavidus sp. U2 TaxID=2920269 RepID=UPI00129D271C|nr:NAD(P)/FAD-dependent oxidoreductase [Cupriavidus sp. U2]KAI3593387.1 Flavin-containing monooxygenase [Cupriavidus sp. U2]
MKNIKETAAGNADAIASDWLVQFNAALAANDRKRVQSLFCVDSHWRDLLALTWKFGTVSGAEALSEALLAAANQLQAHSFEIDTRRLPARQVQRAGEAVVEAIVRFKTAVGEGSGLVRIKGSPDADDVPQAWTLLTTLQSIADHDEETVRLSREESPYERDWHGPNWLDRRREALRYEDRDPTVLIVGGGHAGLSAAASLKALGVETLIVDRMARIGDNWRLRYHALKLHNMTPSNHLPYLPFPSTWPNYIPKDKIANWLEFYAESLEIDFWTSTTFEGATYDSASGRWNASLRLKDGSTREMRPAHVVLATSVSGTPNIPTIPTLERFSGKVVHSSQFSNGAEWKGKNVIIFGTGTSAHDIAQDLHGNGANVTMVQRSPTEVVNVEPSAQLYDGIFYEDGPTIADRDLISASMPLAVLKQSHTLLTAKARAHDAPLHERLKRVGFRLDLDETGWPLKFRQFGGGYYFNVGGSDLIANRNVGLVQYDDIESFGADGLMLKDGRDVAADLVILATGYKGLDHVVGAMFGENVAQRVGPVWGFDDATQELRNMWLRTAQPGLWLTGGAFSQCRIFSKYLAMQIKASELGLLPPSQSDD